MARIRTVKPEMFQSYTIRRLSLAARWTFVGLLTHVDDDGRARDDARLIKSAVWPLEDDVTAGHIDAHVDELVHAGLVCRYQQRGVPHLHVVNFAEHQKINRKSVSKLPGCPVRHGVDDDVSDGEPPPSKASAEPPPTAHGGLSEDAVSPHAPLTEDVIHRDAPCSEGSLQEVEVEVEVEQGSGSGKGSVPPPTESPSLHENDLPGRTEGEHEDGYHARARQLLAELEPARLRPGRGATDLVEAVAGLLAQGWPPRELATRMTLETPDEIFNPAQFLLARLPVPGRYRPPSERTPPLRQHCPLHHLELSDHGMCRGCAADAKAAPD